MNDNQFAAAADTLSSALVSVGNTATSKKQREFAREQAEYAWNKNTEMWNMANEYNSPSAQMERLKAAGLNPNLVYGKDAVGNHSAGQIPKYQAPEMSVPKLEMPNLLNALNSYTDLKQKEANVQLTKQAALYKEIENSYIGSYLFKRNLTLGEKLHREQYGRLKDEVMYGFQTGTSAERSFKNSPFYKKYAAEIQEKELRNYGQTLENSLRKRGINASDSAFLRTIAMDQAGFGEASKMLPYVVGEGVVKGIGNMIPRINLFKGKAKLDTKYRSPYYK